jgi:hypothetical protein
MQGLIACLSTQRPNAHSPHTARPREGAGASHELRAGGLSRSRQ